MNITVQNIDSETVLVALLDRLEALTAQDFRTTVDRLFSEGANMFIVDLSSTPFLDSAGMAALVSLLKRCRQADGDVKLIWPQQEPVKRILQLTRFDKVFEIYETTDDALASTSDASFA